MENKKKCNYKTFLKEYDLERVARFGSASKLSEHLGITGTTAAKWFKKRWSCNYQELCIKFVKEMNEKYDYVNDDNYTIDRLAFELGIRNNVILQALNWNKFESGVSFVFPEYEYEVEEIKKDLENLNEDNTMWEVIYMFCSIKRREVKKRSYITYANRFKTTIIPFFNNDFKMKDYDQFTHDELLEKLSKRVGERSVKDTSILVTQMVAWYKAQGFFKNPLPSSKVTTKVSDSFSTIKEVEVFTAEEEERLKTRSTGEGQLLIKLLFDTGIRIGEASGLMWEDIDFDKKTIHIQRQRQRNILNSKTELVVCSLKSKAANRIIPMTACLYDALSSYDCERTGFVTDREPRSLRYLVTQEMKRCGVKPRKIHAFRHTFATNIVKKSDNYKAICKILGHSNINITMNTYVHTSQEDAEDIMSLL